MRDEWESDGACARAAGRTHLERGLCAVSTSVTRLVAGEPVGVPILATILTFAAVSVHASPYLQHTAEPSCVSSGRQVSGAACVPDGQHDQDCKAGTSSVLVELGRARTEEPRAHAIGSTHRVAHPFGCCKATVQPFDARFSAV